MWHVRPRAMPPARPSAAPWQRWEKSGSLPIPVHLQDRHYSGAEKLGRGDGYKYAHDYPKHYVEQQYLPYEMQGISFYEPSEKRI